jgi:serine O-acetyltransferase
MNPLAHSALPDAEANVIKNLMDRIDLLENEILKLHKTLQCLANSESIDISKLGDAQNLKDKEIFEFLGDD